MSLHNIAEIAAIGLFGIGLTLLIMSRNLIKKVIAFDMADSSLFLFLAAKGYIAGRRAPIIEDGIQSMERYINPIPAGLVLTGIVVSVACSAVMLALCLRLYRRYHTLDIDEISALARKEEA